MNYQHLSNQSYLHPNRQQQKRSQKQKQQQQQKKPQQQKPLGFHQRLFDALLCDLPYTTACVSHSIARAAARDDPNALVPRKHGNMEATAFLAVVAALAFYEHMESAADIENQTGNNNKHNHAKSKGKKKNERTQDQIYEQIIRKKQKTIENMDMEWRRLLEEERQYDMDQIRLENDALFDALKKMENEMSYLKSKLYKTKRMFEKSIGKINGLNDELFELTSKLSTTNWELAEAQSDKEDTRIVFQDRFEDQERLLQKLSNERDALSETIRISQRREQQLEWQIEDYVATIAAKDLKIMSVVEDRNELRQKIKKILAGEGIHSTFQQQVMDRVKDVKINTAISPTRWVNGINRMRRRPVRVSDSSSEE